MEDSSLDCKQTFAKFFTFSHLFKTSWDSSA